MAAELLTNVLFQAVLQSNPPPFPEAVLLMNVQFMKPLLAVTLYAPPPDAAELPMMALLKTEHGLDSPPPDKLAIPPPEPAAWFPVSTQFVRVPPLAT